jgi:lipopolysaccharide export system protein LptC
MFKKSRIITIILLTLLLAAGYLYFRYYFSYEQRNITQRKLDNITGQNLVVTVFGFDGRIIKRWTGVNKITTFKDERDYSFFYTKDGKYVQIPASVWYIAEEE